MIRVAIADDQTLLRDSMRLILSKSDDIEIIDVGSNGKEIIELCSIEKIDVVLMDIKMPVMDGIEATKIIKNKHKDIKIIILTTFENKENVINALRLKADGYILKNISCDQLIQAIISVYNDIVVIQPDIRDILLSEIGDSIDEDTIVRIDNKQIVLSSLDIEIISLVSKGKTNKEIANYTQYAEGTIRNKLSCIYQKLNVEDRTQLTFFALEYQII